MCELDYYMKITGIYEKEVDESYTDFIAFVRDEYGNVTGDQRLLLDDKSAIS